MCQRVDEANVGLGGVELCDRVVRQAEKMVREKLGQDWAEEHDTMYENVISDAQQIVHPWEGE